MRFREKLARFMWGRNGFDNIAHALVWSCLILSIANIFLGSLIIWILENVLLVYCFFRVFSRNIVKRRNENMKFISLWNKIKGYFKFKKTKFKSRKTHIFRVCPECKANLRLPKAKGTHTVKCPRCSHRFEVNS